MKFEEFSKRVNKMRKYVRQTGFMNLYYDIYGKMVIGTNQELLIKMDMMVLEQKFSDLHKKLEHLKFLREVKELMNEKK